MHTQEQLQLVFRNNFVAYFRSHVAHVNIQGRNFYSDHKLLGKIYEHLQANIDTTAEMLRTLGEFMPDNLQGIIVDATIDDEPVTGTDQDFLETVRENLLHLVDDYRELYRVATDESYDEISNAAQDQMLTLNKYIWMLDSTISPQQ